MFKQLLKKLYDESPVQYKSFSNYVVKTYLDGDVNTFTNPWMILKCGINLGIVDKSDITNQDIKNAKDWINTEYKIAYCNNTNRYVRDTAVLKIVWHYETSTDALLYPWLYELLYKFYSIVNDHRIVYVGCSCKRDRPCACVFVEDVHITKKFKQLYDLHHKPNTTPDLNRLYCFKYLVL